MKMRKDSFFSNQKEKSYVAISLSLQKTKLRKSEKKEKSNSP